MLLCCCAAACWCTWRGGDTNSLYYELCYSHVTEGHLTCDKHRNRIARDAVVIYGHVFGRNNLERLSRHDEYNTTLVNGVIDNPDRDVRAD